ncbi:MULTISPECIES: tautomerase family protein [Alphaproteobacteria]|uniref:tautomerase family protein n=1 Tax=Alphaproteobacteria TaxID=28211 RepID=UPI003262D527
MPIAQIQLRKGKPEAYRQAIFDSLYRAFREVLNVPEDDQFMTITEHEEANFRTGSAFGIKRSEDTIYMQITVFDTRMAEHHKSLFKRLADLLGEDPGIRPEDLFINIYTTPKANWSVGNGVPVTL